MGGLVGDTPTRKPGRERPPGMRQGAALALAVAVLLALYLAPLPAPLESAEGPLALTVEGKASLAILACVIVLWMTEALPFAVTALAGLLLIPVFGLASLGEAVSYGFGSSMVIFFVGVLTISSGLTRSGLAARLTGMILRSVGWRPRKIVFTFLALSAALSMWIVNMSVAAILLPVARSILDRSGQVPGRSHFGRSLMIAVAWGAAIGGIATPVGNGANIVALGYLRELAGVQIDFLRWMAVGLPAALLLLPLAFLILVKVYPPGEAAGTPSLPEAHPAGHRLTSPEKKALAIFALTVALWMGDPLLKHLTGLSLPLEGVALGAAILFFLPGLNILTWREAQQDIDWGGIVLIAAGLSMGAVVFQTGAARWLAVLSFGSIGTLALAPRIFLAVLAVEILKVGFSSNTVTGVILVPMVIALSTAFGLDPWYLAGPVAIATSLAFILVTSSPTNMIPYSAGYFSLRDFARAGLLLTLAAPFCITAAFLLFAPLVR